MCPSNTYRTPQSIILLIIYNTVYVRLNLAYVDFYRCLYNVAFLIPYKINFKCKHGLLNCVVSLLSNGKMGKRESKRERDRLQQTQSCVGIKMISEAWD